MLFVEIMTMLDFVICRNGHIKEPVVVTGDGWAVSVKPRQYGHNCRVEQNMDTIAELEKMDSIAELEKMDSIAELKNMDKTRELKKKYWWTIK